MDSRLRGNDGLRLLGINIILRCDIDAGGEFPVYRLENAGSKTVISAQVGIYAYAGTEPDERVIDSRLRGNDGLRLSGINIILRCGIDVGGEFPVYRLESIGSKTVIPAQAGIHAYAGMEPDEQ